MDVKKLIPNSGIFTDVFTGFISNGHVNISYLNITSLLLSSDIGARPVVACNSDGSHFLSSPETN